VFPVLGHLLGANPQAGHTLVIDDIYYHEGELAVRARDPNGQDIQSTLARLEAAYPGRKLEAVTIVKSGSKAEPFWATAVTAKVDPDIASALSTMDAKSLAVISEKWTRRLNANVLALNPTEKNLLITHLEHVDLDLLNMQLGPELSHFRQDSVRTQIIGPLLRYIRGFDFRSKSEMIRLLAASKVTREDAAKLPDLTLRELCISLAILGDNAKARDLFLESKAARWSLQISYLRALKQYSLASDAAGLRFQLDDILATFLFSKVHVSDEVRARAFIHKTGSFDADQVKKFLAISPVAQAKFLQASPKLLPLYRAYYIGGPEQ
jgi:hypothetical protein